MTLITVLITDFLTALKENVLVSLVGLFCFTLILILRNRKHTFKELFIYKVETRYKLLLCFYLFFIIGKTLLIRSPWEDPLSNIMGGWSIYQVSNGHINAESIENFLFFIPFFILLYLGYPRIVQKKSLNKILSYSFFIGLMISLSIEVLQVIFQRGTFQYADLFYNSVGSILGGYIYYLIRKIK